jgi:hypothetical protein
VLSGGLDALLVRPGAVIEQQHGVAVGAGDDCGRELGSSGVVAAEELEGR